MDLGEKNKEAVLYPTAAKEEKDKVRYPEIRLPLKVVSALNMKVGDGIEVKLKGKIVGMENTKWSNSVMIEAHEGEASKSSSGGKSVLEGA